ncbi:sensor histidine kinase [Streptomonospora litoralis]|uniref:histidine kinase n=1 Tax=Streptomonospora litoralis TaxID=2498135 RepID=A0A4P6Q1F1_9ACTN|nr:histidine kinase [Streptomonospora litoralis]QBI52639.1 Sensor histidine kinase LiaS [Streptomonospora litoralis]
MADEDEAAGGTGPGRTAEGRDSRTARRRGTDVLVAAAADALLRRPRDVRRWLPAAEPEREDTAPPLLGGVCAAIAARNGLPAAWVRRRFAVFVVPLLIYPLLWLLRLAERPSAEGRERTDGILAVAAAALGTGAACAAQLPSTAGSFYASLFGLALGAPLLALRVSVLLTWRLMAATLAVVGLLLAIGDAPGLPFPTAAALAYLLVLFLVGTQHDGSTVAAVGVCTAVAVVAITAIAPVDAAAGLWCTTAAAAALLLGDNVRMRRADTGRLRPEPPAARPRSVGAPRAPVARISADAAAGAETPALTGETDGRGDPRGLGAEDSAADHNGNRVPGPRTVVRAVLDALWRTPGGRPQGPLRLFHGPIRPLHGRIIGGVCAGLGRGSELMTITLRILFPIVSFPLGVAAYLLLWLLLPDERAETGQAEPTGSGMADRPVPPVQPREVTAWFLLLGISTGLAALVAAQLVQMHQVDPTLAVLLGAVIGLPFALLPLAPLLTWRIMAAGLFVGLFTVNTASPYLPTYLLWPWPAAALLILPIVLYTVAVNYPGRTTVGVGLVTVVADIFAAYPLVRTHPGQTFWIAVVAGAVLLFGYNVRGRRAAQRRLARESALRRRGRARQAVLEERSRIARELHDVVSHHMSMIAIQADAAPYKFPGLDAGPAATFTTVRDAARDALAEMRRVVGLLREEDEVPEDAPQPGLAMLPDLVESARRASIDVTLEGGPEAARAAARGLPGAADVSAYRIVQESLSNAGRHAPGAPVAVTVSRTAATLTVRVVNGPPVGEGHEQGGGERGSPHPAALDSGGHGLVGMRERTAMLGGSLRAAPTGDGGFDVVAELPVASGAHGPADDGAEPG